MKKKKNQTNKQTNKETNKQKQKQNKTKQTNKQNESESGELQAGTPACRAITRIVRVCLCSLGHGGVLSKSMTFIAIVDVFQALIQNVCNLNQNVGSYFFFLNMLNFRTSPVTCLKK